MVALVGKSNLWLERTACQRRWQVPIALRRPLSHHVSPQV
jgi:hypothetical protein